MTRMHRYSISVVLIAGLLLLALHATTSNHVVAAVNQEINYQGKLTDTDDVAVGNGNYNFRFRLCATDDCTGGSDPLWTETHCYSGDSGATCTGTGTDSRIATTSGLFSVLLGSITSLSSVDFDQTLWLEVQIGGQADSSPTFETLTPRKKLGAVPAAFEAVQLGGVAAASYARSDAADTISGLLTITAPPSGAGVGAGSLYINPSSATAGHTLLGLAVGGTEKVRIDAEGDLVIGNSISTVTGDLTIDPTGDLIVKGSTADSTEAALDVQDSASSSLLYVRNDGNVGIGETSPHEQLTIGGVVSLAEATAPTATSGYGKIYVKSSDSKLYFLDDAGTETDLTAGGGGGGSGSLTTLKEADSQVGGADIVTLDFGAGFDLTESPDTEINVVLDYTEDPIDLGTAEVTGTLDVSDHLNLAAGTNISLSGDTLNVDDAFVSNSADDTMAGDLTIDDDDVGTQLTVRADAANTGATIGLLITTDDDDSTNYDPFEIRDDSGVNNDLLFAIDHTGAITSGTIAVGSVTGTTTDLSTDLIQESELDAESELETQLADVSNVFTNNDGALDDDDLSDDTLNSLSQTSLADPGADQIVFWDDSDTQFEFLSTLTGLSITTNTLSVDQVDISDGTNLAAGTNISLSGDTLNVDDAFVINSGDDVMSGTLTADGLTLGDDENITLGTASDWTINFDDSVDDQLLIATTNTAATATTDPLLEILVGTTPTADQQVFGVAKGTQASNTALFTVDEDGDTAVTGDLTVTGGDITLGTSSIFSGGDTASLNNIDAVDATTETTIEAAIDTLANLTSASALATIGTITSGIWQGTAIDVSDYTNLAVTSPITLTGDTVGFDVTANLSITGDYDFGAGILQVPNSTTLPATCEVGDIYFDTDATSGQRLYACESTNTWALQGDGDTADTNTFAFVEEADGGALNATAPTIDFGAGFDLSESPTDEINVTLDYTEDPIDLGTAEVTGTLDVSDHLNLTAGTNITLTGDQLDVDDAFLVNDADDTTTGKLTITKAGLAFDAQNTTDAASNQVAAFRAGNRATPADLDEGYVSLYSDDSTGTQTEFIRLTWIANDVTNTSKDSQFDIDVWSNNSFARALAVSGTQLTVTGDLSVGGGDVAVGLSAGVLSDSSGTLTLGSIDAIDATTETTLEAAIDALSNLVTTGTLTSGATGSGFTVDLDNSTLTCTNCIDISSNTNLAAGTNISLSGDTLNVDDAFVSNSADDTMAGDLTIDDDDVGTQLTVRADAANTGATIGLLITTDDDDSTNYDPFEIRDDSGVNNDLLFAIDHTGAITSGTIAVGSVTGTTTDLSTDLIQESELDAESELETQLADVSNVFTNNDGALDDDDLSDDTLNSLSQTSLADPGADQIVFWDDSDTQFEFLSTLTGLSITTNTLSVDQVDISDGTNLAAGTNISLSGDTLNVDDAFVINSGDDVMSGTLTADGLTLGDDENITLGTASDWTINFDDSVDDQLLIATTNTAATATTDPLLEILVGTTPTADQQVFGVAKGTQASNTALFTVDEDGDTAVTGDLTVTGGDITLGTSSIFSGGDTASLNNIDAVDATTETTIEAAIDTLANLTSASALATIGTITSGIWQGDTVGVAYGGTGATSLTDGGILFGSGTGAITASAVLGNGELLIGDGTTDPTVGTLTGDDGITITNGAGTIEIDVTPLASGSDADSSTTQSDSGLEIVGNALTLIRGCADNEILKWDETQDDWNCEADNAGGGGGTLTTIKEADSQVGGADIVTIDFGAGFDVSESPDTEVNITLDYTEDPIDLGTAEVTGTLDVSDHLNLTAGTNITLTGDQLDVDDAFIINSGSDVMTGTLTADGLTLGDDENVTLGSSSDWTINFDDSVDDQLLIATTNTAATAITDPLLEILVGTTPTADQQVFGVAKGTQSSNTALFTVDEDGDTAVTGDFTVTGGDITLGTTSIFSGGDTASLNNIDAIDATTETTLEAAIDALSNLVTTGTLTSGATGSGFTVDLDNSTLTCTNCIDISSNTNLAAGTNISLSGDTLNVDDAFVSNSADDTMAGDLTIDDDDVGTQLTVRADAANTGATIGLLITTDDDDSTNYDPFEIRDDSGVNNDLLFAIDHTGAITSGTIAVGSVTGTTTDLSTDLIQESELDAESELETQLADVSNVFTNNDGALDDDDLSDDTLNSLSQTSLADPGADQIVFWDDSDTQFEFLSTLTGLSITTNTLSVDQVDISDGTNLAAGTNISLSGDTLNVDDAFLVNDADDTTTGKLTITKVGLAFDAQNTTDAASNQVAIFKSGNRATPADLDEGYVSFYHDDSTGTQVEFSRLTSKASDVTNTSKDSQLELDIMSGNSLTNALTLTGTRSTFNNDVRVFGGELDIGSTTVLSGGDTTSLDNIDAIDATTETTLEAAIDALSNLVTTGTLTSGATGSGFTVDLDNSTLTCTNCIDISSNTNLAAGTNISLSGDTLNVDDAFVINSGDDVMSGTLTADGLTLGDDENITLGTASDWTINFDDSVDDQLLIATTNTAATATTDPLLEILVGTTPTADQQVFGVAKGTQASNTALFTVDEDGDTAVTGDLTVTGGDITLGTSSIFSGGDTASLNNIDAVDATTETTIEAAIDTLANLTSASALATIGTITSGIWQGDTVGVAYGGTGATSLTDGGILFGSGTGAITASAVLGNGELLIGDGTTDPTVGTLTGDDGITITNGAGTIEIDVTPLASGSDADSSTTQSDSGLEIVGNALTLIRGCADNEILKWDETQDDWNCEADGGGGGTAYDDIAAPDAASTIIFDDTETVTWQSAEDGGSFFTIDGTDTDLATDTIFLTIQTADNDDANFIPLRIIDDSGGTPDTLFEISSDGSVTTTGDLALNGGDLTTTATTFNIDVANTGVIAFGDGTNTLVEIEDNGSAPQVGIGTDSPDALLDVEAAENTELVRLTDSTNTDSVGFFAGSGTPESAVTAQLGSIYVDHASGKVYNKASGDGTNTGWSEMTTQDGGDMAKMRRDAAQSVSASSWTKIAFDAEEYDVGGIADFSTNDRFDIGRAGKYLITAAIEFDNVDDGSRVQVAVSKNGTRIARRMTYSAAAGSLTDAWISTTLDLAVNDYIEMQVWHDDNTSQDTLTTEDRRPRMSIIQLDAGGSGGWWTKSGDDLYYDSGNVGISESTPLAPLHVGTGVSISPPTGTELLVEDSTQPILSIIGPADTGSAVIYFGDGDDASEGWFQYNNAGGSERFDIAAGGLETMYIIGDEVGINDATPDEMFDVHNGEIEFGIQTTSDTTIGVCKSTSDGTSNGTEFRECNGTPSDIAEWYETKPGVVAGDIVYLTNELFHYEEELHDPSTGQPLYYAAATPYRIDPDNFEDGDEDWYPDPTYVTTPYGEAVMGNEYYNYAEEDRFRVPSTVAILDKASADVAHKTIGIVSTSPYESFGKAVVETGENPQPIALAGRVPVKVTLEAGPIMVGDPITAGSTPGVGKLATETSRIIGWALEPYEGGSVENEIGLVQVFVQPGYHFAPDFLAGTGSEESIALEFASQGNTLSVSGLQGLLESLGLFIENGVAHLTEIFVDRVTADIVRQEQAEFVDRTTGEVWCTWVENGEWVKVQGTCDSLSSNEGTGFTGPTGNTGYGPAVSPGSGEESPAEPLSEEPLPPAGEEESSVEPDLASEPLVEEGPPANEEEQPTEESSEELDPAPESPTPVQSTDEEEPLVAEPPVEESLTEEESSETP